MDMGLYEKLIEEGAAKGLKSVKLNFLGEPLLYPALDRMVELAAKAGLWVMLNTNAVLLTEELSRKLLTKGLTDIFFSFDSPYKQVYEKIRVGANYEKVLENVSYFVKVKEELNLKAVQTRASLVLEEVPEGRERIIHDYIKLFRDLKVAEIGFGLPTVMERDYSVLEAPERFVCPDLFRRIFVFHDGLCGPCCGDWERRLIMGNAKIESISSIWNGKAYKSLRNAHLKGQYRSVEACRFCSVPHLSEKSL
jgi:MoaA/NifB/PqqE/SkfB family radical SAM enzyme